MAAPFGNQNAKKLTTPELRKEAYRQYCAHIADGNCKKSWYFEHPDLTLTWETMDVYMRENEVEFSPIQMKVAHCKGYRKWEGVVQDSAIGKNKDANTASLQMYMRNRFVWDKTDHRKEEDLTASQDSHDKLMKQLADAQNNAAQKERE